MKSFVTSKYFEIFMFLVIMVNMVIIILSYLDLNEETLSKVDTADQVIMYIFVVEAIIKIIGLGPSLYFRDSWNRFDFALVITSLCVDVTISVLKVAKNLRSAKSLWIVKLSKS